MSAAKVVVHAARRFQGAASRANGAGTNDLNQDLARLVDRDRKVTFVFSRFDPGYDLLMINAGRMVRRSLERGQMCLWSIKDANHTFDGTGPRAEMIQSIRAHLVARYLPRHPSARAAMDRSH